MTELRKALPKKSLVANRKARFEFELFETYEAGIELVGSEVKSLRGARVHFADAFADFDNGQLYLKNVNIAEYGPSNQFNHKPDRHRRLLLHRHELEKLRIAIREGGMTIVPTEIYLRGSLIKVELAVARGKKLHDKRETIKEREAQREMSRLRK